jgi:hypothetical protein
VTTSVCCGGVVPDDFTAINRRYIAEYIASIGCTGVGCDGACDATCFLVTSASCTAGTCEGGPIGCATGNDCPRRAACESLDPYSSSHPTYCLNTCSSNDVCRAGETCSMGTCTTACESATDCAPEEACVSDGTDSWCRSHCLADDQCRPGLLCHPGGRCRSHCDGADDCPSGSACADTWCWASCFSDAACRDGERCIHASCIVPP